MARILRKKLTKGWTGVPNTCIRDPRLSLRATGLLTYILSMEDGWPVDSVTLSKVKVEGRDAIRKAFKELIDAGYAQYSRGQSSDGRWVTEMLVADDPIYSPTPGNPASVVQITDAWFSDRRRSRQSKALEELEKNKKQEQPQSLTHPTGERLLHPEAQRAVDADLAALEEAMRKKAGG